MTGPFAERALALIRNGYRIIPLPRGKKGPVEDAWESIRATEAQVQAWTSGAERYGKKGNLLPNYVNGNLGILTRDTPVVDLDILHAPMALAMQAEIEQIVDAVLPIPVRIGRDPKRLLLFSTAEPFRKVASPYFVSPDGLRHRIEILGDGQQFVGFGIHPDTRKPFRWVTLEDPLNTAVDELPCLNAAQARRIVERFCELATAQGWQREANGTSHRAVDEPSHTGDAGVIDMRPRLRINTEELRAALELHDGFDDYDTWLRTGMGLHHQFAGSEEGFALWDEWSKKAKGVTRRGKALYDPEALRYRWKESFKQARDAGHGPITCAFIVKSANDKRKQEEERVFLKLRQGVEAAPDDHTLMRSVAPDIAQAELSSVQRGVLAKLMQKKLKGFHGVVVPIRDVDKAIRPSGHTVGRISDELEVALARRVLLTRFEDGAHIKRFAKMWWVYRAGVWRREDEEAIERRVLETLTDLRHFGSPALRELLGKMDESRGDRLNALVSTVTSVMAKLVAEMDNDDPLNLHSFRAPRVINCRNCEVWIDDNGRLTTKDHNPTHLLTTQLACDYDPQATCPTWDASIRKVFQKCADPERVILYFYEVFGCIILATREVAMWVLFKGPGGNGKSFLIRVIVEIMGRGSVISKSIADIANGSGNHFTTSLVGKLMLLDDDLKSNVVLPDDWLKKLSEAKLLTADPKFANSFEFVARSIPVILSNKWPSTTDLSEGLHRRAKVFESDHVLTPEEQDPQHLRTIEAFELPGVLNHLVAGQVRFLNRGCRFDPPAECEAAKQRWLGSSNTTMRFVQDCITRTDRRVAVRASELYDHYINWLRYSEVSAKPLGRNKFYEAMETVLRLKRTSHGNVAHFPKVQLKPLENGFDDLDADDGLEP